MRTPSRAPGSGSRFFPDPARADARGLVAVTEALSVELLLDAYSHGIFPWSEAPVRWFSPDPRAIFERDAILWPKKLAKLLRVGAFRITLDSAFREVIRACADEHRHEGEWIGEGFVRVYSELHEQGHAHSVEVWQGDHLAGGLYGVQIKGLFAGESMFYRAANASKIAFAFLMAHLVDIGITLIDAQVINSHTARLGAVSVRRSTYLERLRAAMQVTPRFDAQKWPSTPTALPPGLAAG